MSWVTGAAVYLCIWCVVVFAVLPWGVKPATDAPPGSDPGAPSNPRLALKGFITTVIAALLWLIYFVIARSDLITFREN
jgi:predicted secreted protein